MLTYVTDVIQFAVLDATGVRVLQRLAGGSALTMAFRTGLIMKVKVEFQKGHRN